MLYAEARGPYARTAVLCGNESDYLITNAIARKLSGVPAVGQGEALIAAAWHGPDADISWTVSNDVRTCIGYRDCA